MLLTDEEREKFATWLKEDINSTKRLLIQLEKLPGTKLVADKLRAEMGAEIVVLEKLIKTESFSTKGGL